MTLTLTLTKTLLGSTWVPLPSLVLIGPAVWPAIGNPQTNTQTYRSLVCRLEDIFVEKHVCDNNLHSSLHLLTSVFLLLYRNLNTVRAISKEHEHPVDRYSVMAKWYVTCQLSHVVRHNWLYLRNDSRYTHSLVNNWYDNIKDNIYGAVIVAEPLRGLPGSHNERRTVLGDCGPSQLT